MIKSVNVSLPRPIWNPLMKEHCLAVVHYFVLLIILNKGIKDIMNI